MRPSASLRYWLARLRPLSNPLTLIPVTVVALMVVLIVEYGKNPQASRWQGDSETSELSPDQQAQAAEAQFDTLGRLLNEPIPGNNLVEPTSESLAQQDAATEPSETAPFAAYLEQYSFGSSSGQPSIQGATPSRGTQLASPTRGLVASSSDSQQRLAISAATGESALSQAIGRLQGPSDADTASASESSEATSESSTDSAISGLPNLPSSQSGVVPGTLPGSNRTFIRTTPNMSPPPGTTGYTPPASLDLSIYNDTLNRSSSPVPGISSPTLNLEQQIPGASNNVLPTPGSVVVPSAPAVPQAAEPDNDFFVDDRSAYEIFWD